MASVAALLLLPDRCTFFLPLPKEPKRPRIRLRSGSWWKPLPPPPSESLKEWASSKAAPLTPPPQLDLWPPSDSTSPSYHTEESRAAAAAEVEAEESASTLRLPVEAGEADLEPPPPDRLKEWRRKRLVFRTGFPAPLLTA